MKTKFFNLIILLVLLSFISNEVIAQTSSIDQQNVPSNTNSTISPGQTFGQSFTAGVTARLFGVGIGLGIGAPVTSCVVKVFAGSGYSGALLAQQNFNTSGPGLNTVTLNTDVFIVSGNVYTFQFSSFAAPIPVNYHNGNPYSGGSYFNNGTLIASADAIFETRVPFVGIPGQFNSAVYNLNELDEPMNFTLIGGSANYRVKVTGVSTTFSAVNYRNSPWNTEFKMSYVKGVGYGETYDVQVSNYIGGAWAPFGVSSTVNTPAITPSPQLTNCFGPPLASTKTIFTWTKVVGATKYAVLVADPATTFSVASVRHNNLNTFALSYVKGTKPNVAYDISIKALVGGVWGDYGFACSVTALSNSFIAETEELYRLGDTFEPLDGNGFSAILYPNPSDGKFNLNLSEDASIIIINLLGDIVTKENLAAGTSILNIETQPNGIYFATINTGHSQKTLKIIKE